MCVESTSLSNVQLLFAFFHFMSFLTEEFEIIKSSTCLYVFNSSNLEYSSSKNSKVGKP